MYPRELAGRLRTLTQKANSAIQEMGTNILYLAFGFLEWYADKNSEVKDHAPLYLVPVNIEKGKLNNKLNMYEYRISYSGEDIMPNLSLVEKLKHDFEFQLPIFDENTTPEQYFKDVNRLVVNDHPYSAIQGSP